MGKFRIDPASLQTAQARIAAFGEKKILQARLALDNWALDTVAEMQKEIEDVKAIDQGMLHAATTKTPVTQTGSVLSVTVFNPLDYAVIVEFGRQAGSAYPPLIPIIAWAVRKGIITGLPVNVSIDMFPKEWAASAAIMRNMGNGSSGSGNKKPIDPITLDFLTVRLIAKKIAEKGIAGRHPFTRAWERKVATFKADISAMMQ